MSKHRRSGFAFSVIVAITGLFLFVGNSVYAGPDGKAVYESANCKMCHGVDGKGNSKLANSMGVAKLDLADKETADKKDAELVKTVTDGAGKMKSYKDKLSPDEITAVVKYIRTLKK